MEGKDVLLLGAAALFIVYKTTPTYRNDPTADPVQAAYDSSEFEVTKKAVTSQQSRIIDGVFPPMFGATSHVAGCAHAGYIPLTPRGSNLPQGAYNDAMTMHLHRNIHGRGECNVYVTPDLGEEHKLASLYEMQEDESAFNTYRLHDDSTN